MTYTEKFCSDDPIRVTFFGDSICVGQGVSIYHGWVTRIAKYLDEYGQQIHHKILVTNSSINGRTTRQALEDMPYSIQSAGVDILVVQFGLNDCNYWETDRGLPRVSPSSFRENLREIIDRGLTFGAFKVLLNNNHPTSRNMDIMPYTSITYEQSNIAFNNVVKELSQEIGDQVLFQDIETCFNKRISEDNPIETLLLPDGLHLSERGHSIYYGEMTPVLVSTIDSFISNGKA